MEKQFCPECGAPLIPSEQTVCPECGCPLPQQALADTVTDSEPKSEAPKAAKPDDGKMDLTAEAAESGYYGTWKKHRQTEYKISCALSVISVLCLLAGIGLGIGFFIYMIVRGIQTNSDLNMFFEFRTKTVKFTALIGALIVAALLFDIIGDCYELAKCSYWLRANGVDTSKSQEVVAYRTASKKKQNDSVHEIELAYCAMHGKKTDKLIAAHIIECIIITVFYITAGITVAIAINGFLAYRAGLNGLAYPIGFTIGTSVAAGLPGLLRSIINKKVFAPAKIWALSQTH
ncbi:MAG: hypothetical protein K2M48_02900 [Clostridiales bacterium]|nr:hypothetical protein [Clostridiales bacterium]